MAIKAEVEALRDVIKPKLPSAIKYRLQQDLKDEQSGIITIKRLNADIGNELTRFISSNEFVYRFIIYGDSELDIQQNAEIIGQTFADTRKLEIASENAWLTLGPFKTQASLETEKAGVFAVVGLITVTRHEHKGTTQGTLVEHINARETEAI